MSDKIKAQNRDSKLSNRRHAFNTTEKNSFGKAYLKSFRQIGECDGCGSWGRIAIVGDWPGVSQCKECYNEYLKTGKTNSLYSLKDSLSFIRYLGL